jgi:hypothetical protein
MLSTFKTVLEEGAKPADVGLYFLHWFTDLAGAEATPLGGAETFVLKFPHSVLVSFLWSIPFLGKLAEKQETEVVERYLRARWRHIVPDRSTPRGPSAIALLRLAVMTQSDERVVDSFKTLPAQHRRLLAEELALTGCAGQHFSGSPDAKGGPAVLVYYGPALMQKNKEETPEMLAATLLLLTEVLRVARRLWPRKDELQNTSVTVNIADLKTQGIEWVLQEAARPGNFWVMLKHNEREGSVKLVQADKLAEPGFHNGPVEKFDLRNFTEMGDSSGESSSDGENDALLKAVSEPHLQHHRSDGYHSRSEIRSQGPLPVLAESDPTMHTEMASLKQENWMMREQVSMLEQQVLRLTSKNTSFKSTSAGQDQKERRRSDIRADESITTGVPTTTPQPSSQEPMWSMSRVSSEATSI